METRINDFYLKEPVGKLILKFAVPSITALLGKPALSMGLSLLRDFVLCVPLILLLPLKLGIYGPLFSAPVADVISFFAVIAVMADLKKLLHPPKTSAVSAQ